MLDAAGGVQVGHGNIPAEEVHTVVVDEESAGHRLDVFLTQQIDGVSRARIQGLIEQGTVSLNGAPARSSARIATGDVVGWPQVLPPSTPTALEPEDIPLDIVYEDTDVVVLDKPAGIVVHPATGHSTGTLVHALLARYPELRAEGGERPGIVHRLDKDTSGLMLVARNDRSMRHLQDELRDRRVTKEYVALCCGTLGPSTGHIEAPIGRHPRNPLKMAVVSNGRYALTEYETLATGDAHTLLRVRLHTGRTHQIRVHLSAIHHPLAGDALYGACTAPGLSRQFLHSAHLALRMPGGEQGEWHSPLPPDLREALVAVGIQNAMTENSYG